MRCFAVAASEAPICRLWDLEGWESLQGPGLRVDRSSPGPCPGLSPRTTLSCPGPTSRSPSAWLLPVVLGAGVTVHLGFLSWLEGRCGLVTTSGRWLRTRENTPFSSPHTLPLPFLFSSRGRLTSLHFLNNCPLTELGGRASLKPAILVAHWAAEDTGPQPHHTQSHRTRALGRCLYFPWGTGLVFFFSFLNNEMFRNAETGTANARQPAELQPAGAPSFDPMLQRGPLRPAALPPPW